jgi:hypothetical protein
VNTIEPERSREDSIRFFLFLEQIDLDLLKKKGKRVSNISNTGASKNEGFGPGRFEFDFFDQKSRF